MAWYHEPYLSQQFLERRNVNQRRAGPPSQALIKRKYDSKAISIDLVLESLILCVLLAEPVEARKLERGHGEGYGTRRENSRT